MLPILPIADATDAAAAADADAAANAAEDLVEVEILDKDKGRRVY